jgi:hypothetical protein
MKERLIELIKLGDKEALIEMVHLLTRSHEINELNDIIISTINTKTEKISNQIYEYKKEIETYLKIFEQYLIANFSVLTLPIIVHDIQGTKAFSFYSYYQAPTIEYVEALHKDSVDIINSTINMKLYSVKVYKGILGNRQWIFEMALLFENKKNFPRSLSKEDYAKYVYSTYGVNLKFPDLLEYILNE